MTYFIFSRDYGERFRIRQALPVPTTDTEIIYVESPRHLQGILLKVGDIIVEPADFTDGPMGQEWMEAMLPRMKSARVRGVLIPMPDRPGLIFHRLIPDGSPIVPGTNFPAPEPDLNNPEPVSWEEIEIGLMTLASAAASMKHQTVGLLGGWKSPWDQLHEQINDQLDAWELAGLEIKYKADA